jgi:uncharacterized membrane protein
MGLFFILLGLWGLFNLVRLGSMAPDFYRWRNDDESSRKMFWLFTGFSVLVLIYTVGCLTFGAFELGSS